MKQELEIEARKVIQHYTFSEDAAKTMDEAIGIANDHIGTEHILYGLLFSQQIREIVQDMLLTNPKVLQADVLEYIQSDPNTPETNSGFTQTSLDALSNAKIESQRLDQLVVNPTDLLVGILESKIGAAFLLLLGEKAPEDENNRMVVKIGLTNALKQINK